jgi:hypothetical protein
MTKLEADLTSSNKELWRCPKCRKLVQIVYGRIGTDELQSLVDALPDEDDDGTANPA